MSTNAKRRASERSRPVKRSYSKLLTVGRTGWLDEVISLGFGAFALFLLIALLSYRYNTSLIDSYLLEGYEKQKNLMGPVGDLLASLLLNNVGWCAFVPVFLAGWLAWRFWNFDENSNYFQGRFKLSFFSGLILMLIFSSTAGALLGGEEVGGIVGQRIAGPVARLFNFWGALLFAVVGLFLSLALVSRLSVAELLHRTMLFTAFALSVLFIQIPLAVIHALLVITQVCFFLLRRGWGLVLRSSGGEIEADELDGKPVLPKPRKRTNEIAAAPAREVEDGEDLEQYSHVVVSRKKPNYKIKNDDSKLSKKKAEKAPEVPQEYVRPDIAFLTKSEESFVSEDDEELIKTSKLIESKLKDFNILGRVTEVHPGPVITLYEFEPAPGVKVGRISALQDDLAMSLRALSIRIIAPIPKRGTVGIEVPNRNRELVRLRDVLESEAFVTAESSVNVALGKDTYGDPVVVDIASMPHLLMAGTTGTGKSVCINTILLSLLYRCTPEELGLIMIDPKILELSVYEGIPHLKVPVVTNAKQAKAVLGWAVKEMDRRYRVMQRHGVRSIDGYNKIVKGESDFDVKPPVVPLNGGDTLLEPREEMAGEEETTENTDERQSRLIMAEKLEHLPKIIIVIDELADLMLAVGREIEELITRLAQKARAAGIHLIVATQRPSVDVITGLIKANFPARLSFRVSSRIDSRTILDSMGAEKLLGRGDMLFQAPGSVHLKRVHGAFVADNEVKKVIEYIKKHSKPHYDEKIMQVCQEALEEENTSTSESGGEGGEYDSFYDKAVELVVQKGQASTSMIQRAFRIGYNRAARIIEMMEKEGVIGPMDGVKPRDVLIQDQEAPE